MSTREIVSLQFGHYSNFIGTHWWNIQEAGFCYTGHLPSEINHDVLYREGVTSKGEVTFTPRLLLVDLKGSLRTLPEHGELYDPINEPSVSTVAWPDHAVEVNIEEKPEKNVFQEALAKQNTNIEDLQSSTLENEVNVWSDYLFSRFHPRTVNIIKQYQHGNQDVPFDVFPLGTSLWHTSDFLDDFSDKIRNYVEECDNPQGFHVTLDATNAFGGVASSCLEYLQDEYDRKSVVAFAAIPSYYSDYAYTNAEQREESTRKDSLRTINLALCMEALSDFSSLTIPVCTGSKGWRQPGPSRTFNHLNYNAEMYYHSSAILAAALDTMTLPYRLRSAQFSLPDFCADLTGHGRKVAAATLCLPFSINKGTDFIDCLDNWDGPLWQSITPNCKISTDKTFQIITVRGIQESRLKRPPSEALKQREMAAYRCDNVKEMLNFYLSCNSYATASHVTAIERRLPVTTPFPHLFDEFVGVDGDILSVPRQSNQVVKNVPVIAGCQSGSSVGDMLETLHRDASRIKIARFHQFKSAGLDSDDYSESLNKLLDLRECYEDSFE